MLRSEEIPLVFYEAFVRSANGAAALAHLKEKYFGTENETFEPYRDYFNRGKKAVIVEIERFINQAKKGEKK
jgi:hypothetical protein